MYKLQIYE